MCQALCWASRLQRCQRLGPNLVYFIKSITIALISAVMRDVKCAMKAGEKEFNWGEMRNQRVG